MPHAPSQARGTKLLILATFWVSFAQSRIDSPAFNTLPPDGDTNEEFAMRFAALFAMTRRAMMLGAASVAIAGSAGANTLASPTGEPLLTVRGAITNVGEGNIAQFDLDLLTALPSETFETSTIWTDGVQEFRGVSLDVLLEHVGATGDNLQLRALNDYRITIPASDAREGGPIVAYEQNGNPMSIRNKGPLWLVYPYDSTTDYQTEEIYARSIWQLIEIEVLP
jgi:hypothetical protein